MDSIVFRFARVSAERFTVAALGTGVFQER